MWDLPSESYVVTDSIKTARFCTALPIFILLCHQDTSALSLMDDTPELSPHASPQNSQLYRYLPTMTIQPPALHSFIAHHALEGICPIFAVGAGGITSKKSARPAAASTAKTSKRKEKTPATPSVPTRTSPLGFTLRIMAHPFEGSSLHYDYVSATLRSDYSSNLMSH